MMTTHVNADGDGVGSEVGLFHLLSARGLDPVIANPTPIPDRFRFIVPPGADRSDHAHREIERADLIAVLDIGDLGRLGDLGAVVARRGVPVICIDHHVSPGTLPPGPRLVAPEATATAELIHDLAIANAWPVTPDVARALYIGILTDTGGFRFSNTTPRALRVAAALLEAGVEPETIYEQVYASAPEGRVRLTAEVLLTWWSTERGRLRRCRPALERHQATPDDPRRSPSPRSIAACARRRCPARRRAGCAFVRSEHRRRGPGRALRRRRAPQGVRRVVRGADGRSAGAGVGGGSRVSGE
jgi:phosphoesterase RecJ-like protein